jgi:hypothetical protein
MIKSTSMDGLRADGWGNAGEAVPARLVLEPRHFGSPALMAHSTTTHTPAGVTLNWCVDRMMSLRSSQVIARPGLSRRLLDGQCHGEHHHDDDDRHDR